MTKTLGMTALAVGLALFAVIALKAPDAGSDVQAGAAPNRALAYDAAMNG